MKKNSLFESKLGRILICLYVAFVLCVCCLPCFVSAASGDPLTVVNNLSSFVFSLIRAVGALQRIPDTGRRPGHHFRQGNP